MHNVIHEAPHFVGLSFHISRAPLSLQGRTSRFRKHDPSVFLSADRSGANRGLETSSRPSYCFSPDGE